MQISEVIELRNKLKAGNNWPLVVRIDNAFRIIDESNSCQFTKWDDANGILYVYSLADPTTATSPRNTGNTISLFAVPYENIQSMETVIHLKDLGTSIDSIGCISNEWKDRIIRLFTKILHPDLVNLSRSDINKATGLVDGYKALDDSDDYYEGRYTQSFAETRRMAEHNAYAAKVAAEKEKQNNN